MRRILVGNNQSVWDLAIQEYGSFEGVKQLMIDNPTKCNFENSIAAGTELIITAETMNKSIFDYFSKKRIKPSTAVDVPYVVWILEGGIWNDNGYWIINKLWID